MPACAQHRETTSKAKHAEQTAIPAKKPDQGCFSRWGVRSLSPRGGSPSELCPAAHTSPLPLPPREDHVGVSTDSPEGQLPALDAPEHPQGGRRGLGKSLMSGLYSEFQLRNSCLRTKQLDFSSSPGDPQVQPGLRTWSPSLSVAEAPRGPVQTGGWAHPQPFQFGGSG